MPVLTGCHVRLEALTSAHAPALFAAAGDDRSTYALTWVPETADEMSSYVERALEEQRAGTGIPFAVRSAHTGEIVGTTRYLNMEFWPGLGTPHPTVVEIGYTWLTPEVQRSGINTEMKHFLLQYAFEYWNVLRVSLKTDERNARSRAAIERIGGRYEGVRRAERLRSDGTIRDTAYFSILASEWPAARDALLERLRPAAMIGVE